MCFAVLNNKFILQNSMHVHPPPLAGNDTHLLAVPFWSHSSGLPPLIIRGIDHMKDVSISETQTLAGKTAVLRPLIVKQRPVKTHTHCFNRPELNLNSENIGDIIRCTIFEKR